MIKLAGDSGNPILIIENWELTTFKFINLQFKSNNESKYRVPTKISEKKSKENYQKFLSKIKQNVMFP